MKSVETKTLDQTPEQEVQLPLYATILTLRAISEQATLFFHCDPEEQRVQKRTVFATTTGNDAPDLNGVDYLGTVVLHDLPVHFFISK